MKLCRQFGGRGVLALDKRGQGLAEPARSIRSAGNMIPCCCNHLFTLFYVTVYYKVTWGVVLCNKRKYFVF